MRGTFKLILIICTGLFFSLLIGCMKGEQSDGRLDIAEEVELVDEIPEENKENIDETDEKIVTRTLYLLDANGMVVPQQIDLPQIESKEVATQVLQYLVKGGPVTSLLPSGFQAVLPEDTEVLSLNLIDDGTLIVDLSKEFKNYNKDDELSIIEAMTYTLTQFDSVERIKLRIEGIDQKEMPVDGTPISEGYSRSNGINIIDKSFTGSLESKAVTMYYPKQFNENYYYVPVTQYIPKQDDKFFNSFIATLLEGPGYHLNLIQVFNPHTMLSEDPVLEDGVLQLVFDESILKDEEESIIADDVIETLVRSLTEQELVQAVDIKVKNRKHLLNEDGKPYEKPITEQEIMTNERS